MSLTFPDRLAVVLASPRNPLNIGAVARAMNNFGFSDLRLVNAYQVAFREARSAVGAAGLLKRAREFRSVAEAIADRSLVVGTTAARNREVTHEMLSLPDAAKRIRGLSSSRVAVLFGSEKRGLANEDLSQCDFLVRIPTVPKNPTMNLGQSVALCLYELIRDGKTKRSNRKVTPGAKSADLERLTAILLEALETSEYLKSPSEKSGQRVRQLVQRLSLSTGDANIFLGMLRQMLWKMRQ